MGTPAINGDAVYHDFRGTTDDIKFTYNASRTIFEACHTQAPDTHFTMLPVTDASDVIVDLEIRFAHLPEFVAHFTWERWDDEEDFLDSFEEGPCIATAELPRAFV